MVYYNCSKRRLENGRRSDNAPITDLPSELLLQITGMLDSNELLRLRLTCRRLAEPCLNKIQDRTKVLYIHPSLSHLKAVPGICAHPFAAKVEEVILLGYVPRREIDEELKKGRNGKTLEKKFATWPMFFPNGKVVAPVSDAEQGLRYTYKVLTESLLKLKKCKHLSYQTVTSKPGFNEIQQSSIETFSKKYAKYPNSDDRVTDIQLLVNLLTNPHTAFKSLSLRTPLPMAPSTLSMYDLPHLTTLELALDIYSNPDEPYWTQQHKWRQLCIDLLRAAENLTNLTLILMGTAKIKRVHHSTSPALDRIDVFEQRWPMLRSLTLRLLPDEWHTSGPQRPTCQMFGDLEPMKRFLTWHATYGSLRHVQITNILFVSMPPSTTHAPSGPPAIDTMLSIIEILRKGRVGCEYVVNKFRHHEYCKKKARTDLGECRCDCGRYTPAYVDGGTFVGCFEGLVGRIREGERRGVGVEEGEEEWRFWWVDEGRNREVVDLERGMGGLEFGKSI